TRQGGARACPGQAPEMAAGVVAAAATAAAAAEAKAAVVAEAERVAVAEASAAIAATASVAVPEYLASIPQMQSKFPLQSPGINGGGSAGANGGTLPLPQRVEVACNVHDSSPVAARAVGGTLDQLAPPLPANGGWTAPEGLATPAVVQPAGVSTRSAQTSLPPAAEGSDAPAATAETPLQVVAPPPPSQPVEAAAGGNAGMATAPATAVGTGGGSPWGGERGGGSADVTAAMPTGPQVIAQQDVRVEMMRQRQGLVVALDRGQPLQAMERSTGQPPERRDAGSVCGGGPGAPEQRVVDGAGDRQTGQAAVAEGPWRVAAAASAGAAADSNQVESRSVEDNEQVDVTAGAGQTDGIACVKPPPQANTKNACNGSVLSSGANDNGISGIAEKVTQRTQACGVGQVEAVPAAPAAPAANHGTHPVEAHASVLEAAAAATAAAAAAAAAGPGSNAVSGGGMMGPAVAAAAAAAAAAASAASPSPPVTSVNAPEAEQTSVRRRKGHGGSATVAETQQGQAVAAAVAA
ncbi:unnamed protein product, partial [Scytosiphon promiscuus]